MYQKKKGPSKMKQDDLEATEAREREAAEQARLQEEEAKRKEEVNFLMRQLAERWILPGRRATSLLGAFASHLRRDRSL